METARREFYDAYLGVERMQATQGGDVLRRAQELVGGNERFAQLGQSAGVDMTRYKVLTSETLNSDDLRRADPKRAEAIHALAAEVKAEYNARRDRGMAVDGGLDKLAQELHSHANMTRYGAANDFEKSTIHQLALSEPVRDTVAQRMHKVSDAIADLPRAAISGTYGAAQSTFNVIDDAGDWLNSKMPTPRVRLFNDQGQLDIGIDRVTDPNKTGLRLPDLPENVRPRTTAGKVGEAVVQFTVGFKGADKAFKGFNYGAATTRTGAAVRTSMQTGATSAVAFDGRNDWRLSNSIDHYLPNRLTGYLAAQPGDSALAGRFKNGVEGMLIAGAVDGGIQALRSVPATRFRYYALRRQIRHMGPEDASAYAREVRLTGSEEARRELLAATIADPAKTARAVEVRTSVLREFGDEYLAVDLNRFTRVDGQLEHFPISLHHNRRRRSSVGIPHW